MAYNTSWMDNATTIADAFVGGLTQEVTGSTLAIGNAGFMMLLAAQIITIVAMSNKSTLSLPVIMTLSSFPVLIIGVLLSALGVYAIFWNGLFLVVFLGGIMINFFKGG